MVGRRHPVIASVFIFTGLVLLLSMLDYAPGQEIFFKPYLETFLTSTQSAGYNICGKFGATFCVIAYASIGWGAFMIPVYLLWIGGMAFQRRVSAVSFGTAAAAIGGALLLPIFTAILQAAVQFSGEPTPFFQSGWGGKFGTVVYDRILGQMLSFGGSALLIGSIYLFCLIVVFVDSPIEAAKELAGVAKKSPSVFVRVAKILWIAVSWLPKKIIFARAARADEAESDEQMLAVPRRVKLSVRTQPAEVVKPEESHVDVDASEPQDAAHAEQEPEMSEPSQPEDAADEEATLSPFKKPLEDFTSRFDDGEEEEHIDLTSVKTPAVKKQQGFVVERIEKQAYVPPQSSKKRGDYVFPSIDLLTPPPPLEQDDKEDYQARITEIVQSIGCFDNIRVKPYRATPGPVITRYEVVPAPGVRISKIEGLEKEIAMALKASQVRVIAPIPGAGTVGIEVPNRHRQTVSMREIFESKEWNETKATIPIALGKDVAGRPVVLDLAKMPHGLIAGTTGSGKSVCLSAIIMSLIYKMSPEDLRLILVDPKRVEMQMYNPLPHMLIPVLSEPKKVPAAFKWLISEMDRRYKLFVAASVKNIAGFNAKIAKDKEEAAKAAELDRQMSAELTAEERAAQFDAERMMKGGDISEDEIPREKMPYIVCIVDEFNDLMKIVGKEFEAQVTRITQLARAAGIHLLLATQRPSTDVITGVIKANLPTRIALTVSSYVDSRTILDAKGAERLIGKGDMLFVSAESAELVRAQCAFLSDSEIARVVDALKINGEPEYAEDVQAEIDNSLDDEDGGGEEGGNYDDPMTAKAIGVIRATKKASTSLLQRKLGIGYGRAARIIDELEEKGIIGPDNGPGAGREIYLD